MRDYFRLLEGKIESLALACQALWEILRESTHLTENEMMAKMQEIDLRDGRADGRLSAVADTCRQCGRKTSRRRDTCLYCGAQNPATELLRPTLDFFGPWHS